MIDEDRKRLSAEIHHSLQDPTKTTTVHPLLEQKIRDSEQDRSLKKKYAYWFVKILICQLIIMNLVFICVGVGKLHFETWSLNLYTSGTLAEVFGIVLVITKNLFPSRKF